MRPARNFTVEPWILATRPKTLSASIVPVMVGTALAYNRGVVIDWSLVFCALLVAFMIQIGTNLVNDALDSKKGGDTNARIGPLRVTQMGLLTLKQVLMGGMLCFAFALFAAFPLMLAGGPVISVVVALCVLMGYLYTGGPFPLAYIGLGDLFVLLFFGVVATSGMFYVLAGSLDFASIVAGVQVGLLATVMIAINNLRDLHEDSTTGKRTTAVRFGKMFARCEIAFVALVPFALSVYWIFQGDVMTAILPTLVLPFAFLLVRTIWSVEPCSRYNQFLGMGALIHFFFGVLFSIGQVIG